MKKTFCLLFIFFIIISCQDSSYQLGWKLNSRENLIYLTRLEIIKGSRLISDTDQDFELSQSMAKALGDSLNIPFEMSETYENIIKQSNAVQHFSVLEPNSGDISLEIIAKRKKQISQPKYPFESFIPAESVYFSGKIKSDNSLEENRNDFQQNYMVNILFELPKKKVAIGDSWPLDLKIFNFNKKSSINKVSLVDIVTREGDEIALMKYRIKSNSARQNMFIGSINYEGTAEFNITKGKWEHLEGILIFTSKILTEMKQTQRIELKELSQKEYKALIESYDNENWIQLSAENSLSANDADQNSNVDNAKKMETIKCPVIYSVQIMATADPLPLNAKVFKNIPYKIEQRVEPAHSKFKYKYLVGNECSKDDAFKIKEQIIAAGFPEAFIVKKRN